MIEQIAIDDVAARRPDFGLLGRTPSHQPTRAFTLPDDLLDNVTTQQPSRTNDEYLHEISSR